jgi:hypothetical protein
MIKQFNSIYCKGNVTFLKNNEIIIEGEINDEITDPNIQYYAPAPPDYMTTFSGSGLPFASESQAFSNTPNKGIIKLDQNKFVINMACPNSYYKDFNTYVTPSVTITYNNDKNIKLMLLNDKIAHRSLQYPELRKKEQQMFYNRKLPIRSQEKILRDSEYNLYSEPVNFWGLKPPM